MESILTNSNSRIVLKGDINSEEHIDSIIYVIDKYKSDKMGEEKSLLTTERMKLRELLLNQPSMDFFLIYIEGELAGGSICFRKFSSFSAMKILNIHDFFIMPNIRGLGLGRVLMEAIISYAKENLFCKVTLEVREDNRVAQNLYNSIGFTTTEPNMFFWQKSLLH